jgi:hypothetical protein
MTWGTRPWIIRTTTDLHATILNQIGLDWKKMEYKVFGRTMRLVEEGQGPIQEIIA